MVFVKPARVDEYFALKKVEADWALEWARPAGLKASGRPGLLLTPFSSIFRVRALLLILHLSPVVTLCQNISENV